MEYSSILKQEMAEKRSTTKCRCKRWHWVISVLFDVTNYAGASIQFCAVELSMGDSMRRSGESVSVWVNRMSLPSNHMTYTWKVPKVSCTVKFAVL